MMSIAEKTKEFPMAGGKVVAILDLSALEANRKTREDARAELPKLIIAAREDGWSWPSIAAAAGLSRQACRDIVLAANKGVLPTPRQR